MADETPDTEAPEAEAAAPETEAAPDAAPETEAAAEPEVKLPPKEARRQARQRQPSSRRPGTPEERVELRKAKAAARRRRREQERTRAREAREAGRASGGERTPSEGTPPAPEHTGNPQVRTGTVVSDKADKTITVRIEKVRRHRRYGKVIRSTTTMHAHDERNDAHTGDLVRVVESRPLSRTKRWRLVEILERAK